MNIRLWDSEDYEYPLIRIKDGTSDKFRDDLNNYRANHSEDYNIDDFLELIETKPYFIEFIYLEGERIFF